MHAPPHLMALAQEMDLDAQDLDELVYDVAGNARAGAYNSGEDDPEMGLAGGDPHDAFFDAYDAAASTVNNGGVEEQVLYLVQQVGAIETERLLRSLS